MICVLLTDWLSEIRQQYIKSLPKWNSFCNNAINDYEAECSLNKSRKYLLLNVMISISHVSPYIICCTSIIGLWDYRTIGQWGRVRGTGGTIKCTFINDISSHHIEFIFVCSIRAIRNREIYIAYPGLHLELWTQICHFLVKYLLVMYCITIVCSLIS